MSSSRTPLHQESQVVHPEPVILADGNLPIVSPIYQSMKFTAASLEAIEATLKGERRDFLYYRAGNPTVRELELLLAQLQGREDGLVCASGMGAIATLMLGLLGAGDHIIFFLESYASSRNFIRSVLPRWGIENTMISVSDPDALEKAVRPGKTKLIIFESPTNPLCLIPSIDHIVSIARRYQILTCLDNTFAGFHNHGQYQIDFFVHSLTKFAGGHSDVAGGIVIGASDLIKPLRLMNMSLGSTLDPHAAFLILRGMKSYFLRYRQQCTNAQRLAQFLCGHFSVKQVHYPGLETHPQRDRAKLQQHDAGAVVTFELHGGAAAVREFISGLSLFKLAWSLGSVESLVAPARIFFGHDLTAAEADSAGLCEGLVRLAVGIENIADLQDDLISGFKRITP